MKKLFITMFIVAFLFTHGISYACLHGTMWRNSIGSYYMGFYNGAFYNSTDGVVWDGGPWWWMYVDFNDSYCAFTNPFFLIFRFMMLEFGTYTIEGSSGTLHSMFFAIYFFVPVVDTLDMNLIITDWAPPTVSARGKKFYVLPFYYSSSSPDQLSYA